MSKAFMISSVLLIGSLALIPEVSDASTRAVPCHGCSTENMEIAAGNATQNGTVFVFNEANGDVREYHVFSELVDTRPRTWWKQVIPRSTPTALKNAYSDYLSVVHTLETDGYELPPDFPVASAAGAVSNTAYFSGQVSALIDAGAVLSLRQRTLSFLESWAIELIPFSDFGRIMGPETITFIFSDDSYIKVEFSIREDATGADTAIIVDAVILSSARDQEGKPIPSTTNAATWNGFSMTGNANAVREWLNMARAAGVTIVGSAGSSRGSVICATEKGVTICWRKDAP